MKTTQRTFKRIGLVAGTSLLALAAIGPAASPALAKPSGTIWTTKEACADTAAQNANSYAVGETVYVRGAGFAASAAYSWTITGKPGHASSDPNTEVANGSGSTDATGAFCAFAYVVAVDDSGEYSVEVTQDRTRKNDNYRVEAESDEDSGDEDADEPSDDPGDEPVVDETPTDDPGDQGDEETVEEPSDDPGDQGDEETVEEPTDDPVDEPVIDETPTDDPADDPADEPVIDETPTDEAPVDEDTTVDEAPANDAPPATETGGQPDSDTNYSQDVLGAVGGPSLTPPPSDTEMAPSGQTSGNEWRLILAFLGVLVLVATLGLPERRRAA